MVKDIGETGAILGDKVTVLGEMEVTLGELIEVGPVDETDSAAVAKMLDGAVDDGGNGVAGMMFTATCSGVFGNVT